MSQRKRWNRWRVTGPLWRVGWSLWKIQNLEIFLSFWGFLKSFSSFDPLIVDALDRNFACNCLYLSAFIMWNQNLAVIRQSVVISCFSRGGRQHFYNLIIDHSRIILDFPVFRVIKFCENLQFVSSIILQQNNHIFQFLELHNFMWFRPTTTIPIPYESPASVV